MELPLRAVIAMIIVALLLVVVSFFITTSSSPPIQQGDAERIFSTMCQQYKIQKCPWAVTREASFDTFLTACRTLYGDYRDKFSCLYSLCQACKEFEPTPNEVTCAGICESCDANARLGLSTAVCCSNFKSNCAGVNVQCGVCGI